MQLAEAALGTNTTDSWQADITAGDEQGKLVRSGPVIGGHGPLPGGFTEGLDSMC